MVDKTRVEVLTQIDMVQESQVHSCGDIIFHSFSEDHMAAIVAFMKCREDVGRIISGTVIVTFHVAHFRPRGR